MIRTEIKNISNCRKELNIVMDKADLEPIREKQVKRVQKEVQYPGFRKGKAPIGFVKSRFSDLIEAYTLETAADESLKQAAVENKIEIVDQPEAKKIEYNDDGDLVSVIEVDVYPEIEVKKIDGFELTKDKYVITDKMVEESINQILHQKAEISSVSDPIGEGMIVTIDMQELDETGYPVIGKKYDDINVRVGEGKFDPDLEKQLIGLKEDADKKISKVYPDDFPQKEFAGKKEQFQIKVKKVQKEELPELNDEFVESLGEDLKTVDDLKDATRKKLEHEYTSESENRFASDLSQQLLEANPFDVPQALIENYLNHIVEDVKRRDPKAKEDIIRQHYQSEAEFTIKMHYLKDQIAKDNNITVEDEDMNSFLEKIEDEKVREFYEKNQQILDRAKEDILNKKITDYIVSKSKVKENEIKLD